MASENISAVCIKCGAFKEFPWELCDQCGLNPEQDEQSLVKSVYLSVGRYEEEDDRKRYSDELREIANRIRSGESIEYPPSELICLLEQKKLVDAVTGWHLVKYLMWFFLPGILFVAALFLMGYVLQWLTAQR